MAHESIGLPLQRRTGGTVQRPPLLHHQALLEGIRHLLPLLTQEATTALGSAEHLQAILDQRTTWTGVPEHSFDHTPFCRTEQLAERVANEAVFTFLVGTVFCEALWQSYGLSITTETLARCIPEITAYTWFTPSHALRERLQGLLHTCKLTPIPMHLAGEIYEGALTREERKALGQYYTPPGVADHLLDQVGYTPDTGSCIGPILDVATGFGIFLAQATKRLVCALRTQNITIEPLCRMLELHIHGYDINPFAVIATKFHALAALLDELAPDRQEVEQVLQYYRLSGVHTADTLSQPLVSAAQAPCFIIGNPPYGNCSAGQHLDPYREVLDGRANLYQLFLYFAIQRCAADGHIAFLMPESLRSGRYFTALRRYLSAQFQVETTTDFQTRTTLFSDVEQGVLILAGKKKPEGVSSDLLPVVHVVQAVDEHHLTQAFSIPHAQFQLGATMDYMLPKAGSAEAYALLSRFCQFGSSPQRLTLGAHTGRFIWNQQREYLTAQSEGETLPVLYAQSIQRFAFAFPPHQVERGRRSLLYASRVPKVLSFTTTGPVVLLQRTTAKEQRWRLIATMLPADFLTQYPLYLVENHVNYIDSARLADAAIPLLYVLGLLNSRLLNYVFQAFSGTASVSVWEIQHLPLLFDPSVHLEDLVAQRLAASGEEAAVLEQKIHTCVYNIYQLSTQEQSLIDHFYSSLSCAGHPPKRGYNRFF